MAQSALTVTPPNPTPPTNFACTGATPPNPPNYTRRTVGPPPDIITNPPPFFDDGSAGSLVVFATNTAALASGTSAADNNTGTTPGTVVTAAGGTGFNSALGTYPGATSGLVPASTSVAAEGAGTETLFTQTYSSAIFVPVTLTTVGSGPNQTAATLAAGPNASHASTLSPTTAPTLTSASGASNVSGAGTTLLTATGTGFNRQSVIWSNGIPYPTTFVSATSLTCTAPKKATAGTLPVNIVTGLAITTATVNWTFT